MLRFFAKRLSLSWNREIINENSNRNSLFDLFDWYTGYDISVFINSNVDASHLFSSKSSIFGYPVHVPNRQGRLLISFRHLFWTTWSFFSRVLVACFQIVDDDTKKLERKTARDRKHLPWKFVGARAQNSSETVFWQYSPQILAMLEHYERFYFPQKMEDRIFTIPYKFRF